jgi:2-C-methyl-D-erythritol 4-phosphate cytidylyltransferase
MNYGLIVAAGKSERMGPNVDKAFLSLGTKPVLAYALGAFEACDDIDGIVLVVRKDRVAAAGSLVQMYGFAKVRKIVAGGRDRQDSVANGLAEMGPTVRIVAVHDGARPCVSSQLISETIKVAKRYGSGVAAVKLTDTVKLVERGMAVTKTIDRAKLWTVQTPQAFKRDVLDAAFAMLRESHTKVTDESSAVELAGETVRLVAASAANIKITSPDDLPLAAALLKI